MKTKRLLNTLLAVCLSLSAFTAAAFDVGDLAYDVLTEYTNVNFVMCNGLSAQGKNKNTNGTIGDITIPSGVTYNGTNYRVYNINASAFASTNITGVRINWGVYSIDPNAFQNCKKLTTVHLASSVGWIGSNAFAGCSALKQVYLNRFSLPTVYAGSFPSNSGMTLYVNREQTTALSDIKTTANFTMFSSVVYDNKGCSDVYLHNANDKYGYGLTIGTSDGLGYGSTHDATVTYFIPDYPTINGRTTSSSSSSDYLKGVTYKWTKIGTKALPDNSNVTTIDLTNATNLTSIREFAFTNSTALTKVTIPKAVSNISISFVDGCSALTDISVVSDNSYFSTYSNCLYNKNQSELIRVPEGKSSTVNFPTTLKTVRAYAFDQCKKVETAFLPYGVQTIGNYAFRGASNLGRIKIPSSVTSLGASGVFYGVKSSCDIYCNMQNPPTVTASSYFGTNSSMYLYVPYGKESTYSSAGWTGFKTVNYSGTQAYDIESGDFHFTISSTAATTVNGTSYAGRARLVCGFHSNYNTYTAYIIPASFSHGGKTYAVTKIGEKAFQNHTSNFSVDGCANIDTVGYAAFENQPITKYAFTHNLKVVEQYAFDGAGFTGTLALPYGIERLGIKAFAHGKYERIIVPSSLRGHYGDFCANTSTLKELIWNKALSYNYTGWELTNVPANCYIRVPMGYVNHFKQGTLKDRASYITGGAYDFAYSNGYTGRYFITITSTTSNTFDGVTYDGKAKYVYHPNIKAYTSDGDYGWATFETDKTVANDTRKYLITELGDSLLAGVTTFGIQNNIPKGVTRIGQSAFYGATKVSVANLTLPTGLTYIGNYAFYSTALSGEIKIPSSVTYIGSYAFANMSKLNALYFPSSKPSTLSNYAWSTSNASNFTVWVPNEYANGYLTAANGWGSSYAAKLAVWIKPYAATQGFSSVIPVDLQGSNITGYYASNFDKSNTKAQVTLTKANMAPENTGLLLVDLTADKEYRVKRPTSAVSAPMTNYLVAAPTAKVDVYNQTVGYYWQYRTPDNLRFVRPTSNYNTSVGSAYLKLSSAEASGLTEVYTNLWPKNDTLAKGDVNGDGKVDVEDVNAVINIILKVNTASSYKGNADVNNDNKVDVEDVNAIINIILKV